MAKKSIGSYIKLLFAFLMGCAFVIFAVSLHDTRFYGRQRKAQEDINYALEMKLKNDISYVQYCDDDAEQTIKNSWPLGVNSFYVIIDDNCLGSYVGRAFFDTGDVFYIETSCREGIHKVVRFEKTQWPEY